MRLVNYVKDTKSELAHVSWPTRAQAVNFTALVIGLSIVIALLLGGFDLIFNYLIKFLL